MENFSSIFRYIMEQVREQAPLIHCIANPISIHDCANVVLAAGARPIMAEHPGEVREITAGARALALNIGNITDARKESVLICMEEAARRRIPAVLDMVGIGCSSMRRQLVLDCLERRREICPQAPLILKGNLSEIKTLATAGEKEPVHTDGVDARACDGLTRENEAQTIQMIRGLAAAHQAVILATGKTDVIADERNAYLADNGCPAMSQITGTGCMLTVLAAVYASQSGCATGLYNWQEPFNPQKSATRQKPADAQADSLPTGLTEAALLAALVSGICGERAAEDWKGTGTFQVRLMDEFSGCTWELVEKYRKVREWNE